MDITNQPTLVNRSVRLEPDMMSIPSNVRQKTLAKYVQEQVNRTYTMLCTDPRLRALVVPEDKLRVPLLDITREMRSFS